MKYSVNWKALWKKLARFMTLAISVAVTLALIVRYFKTGMDVEETFRHVSLLQLPLMYLGISVFSLFFAFVVSASFKLASVTITDECISGRNYWFFKNTIPLNCIKELSYFSSNGIEAVVASGGKHGKVYISTSTVNLDSLVEILEYHIAQNNA
ncbi:hypothetical protein [Microbulbifer sp. Q7]|uniref:hypothetical protein n=1 Tax=Microbulbifer sp. Q7 TaxID=1785091 RepID=UPI00128FF104|nr:hypothetical protein [Microbulbifer sp. Q7]